MDAATLSGLWPIENPAQPEPLRGGLNNRTFRVRSDSGDFILRIYPASARPEQIDFEMSLLTALSRLTLPFLLRLRRAATLVWWAGRYRQGTADEPVVQWAVSSALEMEDWLDAHRTELAAYAARFG